MEFDRSSLFQPLIEELQEYLKNKLDKQRQYSTLAHLIKPLGQLCEQLNRTMPSNNPDIMMIQNYLSEIVLDVVQHRIDHILNKKIFDHYESFDKLEEYQYSMQNCTFVVYPDTRKLAIVFADAKMPEKYNSTLNPLFDRATQILHTYPSSISLEHGLCIVSSLASIHISIVHDRFESFLRDFCQQLLTHWQVTLLHDGDADDWSNNKSYLENTRYSVCIDALFYHFNRLQTLVQRFCPILLSSIIPFMLLELMRFIHHHYASIKISYARINQYKSDLLAFLVHASELTHYFSSNRTPINKLLLLREQDDESKFVQYGNALLASLTLVTCPCDMLLEQLQTLVDHSTRLLSKMNWLNIVRSDWFDVNNEMRSQVQTFLTVQQMFITQENHFPLDHLATLVAECSELNSCRTAFVHLLMQYEQWKLIPAFVRYEHDWSFLKSSISTKMPAWLLTMMEYWKEFFAKCCCACQNEQVIKWQKRMEFTIHEHFDERSDYLKSLKQSVAVIPISLHHLLSTIVQYQPHFSKRWILAHLLYKYMIDTNMDRAHTYYLFLTDQDEYNHQAIDRLLDRKSILFRNRQNRVNDEQTIWQHANTVCEVISDNFEWIRSHLDVRTLEEYFSKSSQSYSHPLEQRQKHRAYGQSMENLSVNPPKGDRVFTDLNLRASKRSLNSTIATFRIDYALVNRIELDWPILFTHIVARLKPSIIYHFVTLRFELQASSASSLTDTERLAVGKLLALLPSFYGAKK